MTSTLFPPQMKAKDLLRSLSYLGMEAGGSDKQHAVISILIFWTVTLYIWKRIWYLSPAQKLSNASHHKGYNATFKVPSEETLFQDYPPTSRFGQTGWENWAVHQSSNFTVLFHSICMYSATNWLAIHFHYITQKTHLKILHLQYKIGPMSL